MGKDSMRHPRCLARVSLSDHVNAYELVGRWKIVSVSVPTINHGDLYLVVERANPLKHFPRWRDADIKVAARLHVHPIKGVGVPALNQHPTIVYDLVFRIVYRWRGHDRWSFG
jgi:hypothetical protein